MSDAGEVFIRAATERDVDAIARVHVASWRSTYRGIVPAAFLDNLRVDQRVDLWRRVLVDHRDRQTVYVAESANDGVVGFASAGPCADETLDFDQQISAIYLLADFQGRGLGRRLVAAVASDLASQGARSLCLWVLAANPSRGFYERLGGRAIGAKPIEFGGVPLEEIAYGWDDIGYLVKREGEDH
jgi:L-amino acid N-acyltransferase YncA